MKKKGRGGMRRRARGATRTSERIKNERVSIKILLAITC